MPTPTTSAWRTSRIWTSGVAAPRRIGRIQALFAPAPRACPPALLAGDTSCAPLSGAPRAPPQPAGAARSTAPRDLGWCWTGVAGWERIAPQGCPGGQASGRATGQAGGEIANEIAHTQKGETSLCGTHVAPERTELIAPAADLGSQGGQVRRRDRLGGLLRYYYRDAA